MDKYITMIISKALYKSAFSIGFKGHLLDAYHIMFTKYPTSRSVKDFLQKSVFTYKPTNLPTFKNKKDKDKLIVEIEGWVRNNIKYTSDKVQHKQKEYWQYPLETLESKKGDCEDMHILVYALAMWNGISPLQLGCMCGDVNDGTSSGTGGHFWLEYLSYDMLQDYIIDSCYHPSKQPIRIRPARDIHTYYKKRWWKNPITHLEFKIKN